MSESAIRLSNVWIQNLQGISLQIPHRQLSVVTGPSGSGKSTLVFSALQKEAWRRLGRGLLGPALNRELAAALANDEQSDMLQASGLLFPISVRASNRFRSARHTVSSLAGIDPFLSEIFFQFGVLHCANCGGPLRSSRQSEILSAVLSDYPEGLLEIAVKLPPESSAEKLLSEGFTRIRKDDETISLEDVVGSLGSDMELVLDTVQVESDAKQLRLLAALRVGFGIGDGVIRIRFLHENGAPKNVQSFSLRPYCASCELTERPLHRNELKRRVAASEESRGRRVVAAEISYDEVMKLRLQDLMSWSKSWSDSLVTRNRSARLLSTELMARLQAALDLGLGYLQLDRGVRTLSSGESSRLELVRELGSSLMGVMYLFDEPTSGLHPKNSRDLLRLLDKLKSRGSTLIVIEHDPQVISKADHVIELGPGGGTHGGRIIAHGPPMPPPPEAVVLASRKAMNHDGSRLRITNAHKHNLKNLCVEIPLKSLVVICGVSGSGKSTLLFDEIVPRVQAYLSDRNIDAVSFRDGSVEHVVAVGERGVFRDRRSTVATAAGIAPFVRELFAMLPESQALGLSKDHFSFRSSRGRCPQCQGSGYERLGHVRLDLSAICGRCQGKRLNELSLRPRYRGKNIAEWYDATVEEWEAVFKVHPRIGPLIVLLREYGLGYLRLSQAAPTLSAGEQQRLRIVTELAARKNIAETLFTFEEPTRGLSSKEVSKLIEHFHHLVRMGATVIVAEHHLQMLAEADFIIELGPDAGAQGGEIIAQGSLKDIKEAKSSAIATFLK